MLNGIQFLKMLAGQLKVDEEKVNKAVNDFTRDYPFGELVIDRENFSVRVKCKTENGTPLCMKCGNKMNSRVNQYRKNGVWTAKKKKDNFSNWECPSCYPAGGAPLLVGFGIGED